MNANEIREIINNIFKSPYKSIMIDGAWGIGKTYEIQKCIRDKNNMCIVSLFGLHECNDIYKEIFWELRLKDREKQKIIKAVVNYIGKFFKERIGVKECLEGALKQIVHFSLKKCKDKEFLIVFDDLERTSKHFVFEEFLGAIEGLLSIGNAKIALIANTKEFEPEKKEIYEKYNEKIVEKTYTVNQISKYLDWEKIGIEKEFITEFIEKHKINNLRTIKKAQKFYEDVNLSMGNCFKEYEFIHIIRLVCYSIVVEEIEKIYLNKLKEKQLEVKDDIYFSEINKISINNFAVRIKTRYLFEFNCEISMIEMLHDYYLGVSDIDVTTIKMCYEIYKKLGKKDNFYKSDEELKLGINEMLVAFEQSSSVLESIAMLNTMGTYMEVLEIDTTEFYNMAEKKVEQLIDKTIDKEGEFHFETFSMTIKSKEIKELIKKLSSSISEKNYKKRIEKMQEYIEKQDFENANECLNGFESCWYNYKGSDRNEYLEKILTEKILPEGSINENQWQFLHSFFDFSKDKIGESLKLFTDGAINNSSSKMLKYRMECLKNQYLIHI